jgi:hypothetical protein
MAIVLWYLMRGGIWRRHLLQFYLIASCAFRVTTELIRPEPVCWAGMTFYQIAAIGLGGGLALQWFFERTQETTTSLKQSEPTVPVAEVQF